MRRREVSNPGAFPNWGGRQTFVEPLIPALRKNPRLRQALLTESNGAPKTFAAVSILAVHHECLGVLQSGFQLRESLFEFLFRQVNSAGNVAEGIFADGAHVD